MDSRKSIDLLESLPNWEIGTESEVPMLRRLYRFDDFTQALAFTNQVAALAEAEDHPSAHCYGVGVCSSQLVDTCC